MVTISTSFKAWPPLHVKFDPVAIRAYLEAIGRASTDAFRSGMGSGGRSSPGQYPNVQTGRLRGTIGYEVAEDEVTVKTDTPYSVFLHFGTSKMAKRKMSDDALKEGVERVSSMEVHFAKYYGWGGS
jgi:hypothetical protein